jgi:hypothetical protein
VEGRGASTLVWMQAESCLPVFFTYLCGVCRGLRAKDGVEVGVLLSCHLKERREHEVVKVGKWAVMSNLEDGLQSQIAVEREDSGSVHEDVVSKINN